MKSCDVCLQVIDDCKKEYLEERNYYRLHGKPLKEGNRESRQVKFWIDLGKSHYQEAKAECEQTGEKFDWMKLCRENKFLPK